MWRRYFTCTLFLYDRPVWGRRSITDSLPYEWCILYRHLFAKYTVVVWQRFWSLADHVIYLFSSLHTCRPRLLSFSHFLIYSTSLRLSLPISANFQSLHRGSTLRSTRRVYTTAYRFVFSRSFHLLSSGYTSVTRSNFNFHNFLLYKSIS